MAKFLKFIVNTIMIAAIVVAASLLVPPLAGVTTLIVDDIEMETNLEPGSVTYAWGVDAKDLSVGDKVLLHENEDGVYGDNVYYISSISGSAFTLEDQLSIDGGAIQEELNGTIDKVILTVPFVGYISMALGTVEGLIIVGLSVVFVIILFILAEIWRKEEEDEEEDDDEDDEQETDETGASSSNAGVEVKEDVLEENISDQEQDAENELVEVENKDIENVAAKETTTGNEFAKVEQDLFEETSNALAADIARMMGVEPEQVKSEELKIELQEELQEEVQEEVQTKAVENSDDCEESEEKILAMPSYTKEELIERAKAAGDEPELVMDELSGVTFLDYSDIL